MRNYQAELNTAASDVATIADEMLNNAIAESLRTDVQKKTADLRPGIMFYGVYNSGKSTLLNALLGDERATMADKPETSIITEYDWNGYRVFDSPGIDAPIEHEKVSKDHLNKVEVVLFVVSTNGVFEERRIYEEIGSIVLSDKPLALVLNNKSGLEPESRELAEIEAKVQKNLLLYGDVMPRPLPLILMSIFPRTFRLFPDTFP